VPRTAPGLLSRVKSASSEGKRADIASTGWKLAHERLFCKKLLLRLDWLGRVMDSEQQSTFLAIGRSVERGATASAVLSRVDHQARLLGPVQGGRVVRVEGARWLRWKRPVCRPAVPR
jgi:hypothetical protein